MMRGIVIPEQGACDRVVILPDWDPAQSTVHAAFRASVGALRGALPPRYARRWDAQFFDRAAAALTPGMSVLDVGSGRSAALSPENRPPHITYVGLDISARELANASDSAYDDSITADISTYVPALAGKFDLVLSRQVFEHVESLTRTFANVRAYLKPDGRLIALFSGKYSWFALLSQLLPHRLAVAGMTHLLGRDPETVFPAHYDDCSASDLSRLLLSWSRAEVISEYRGVNYTRFSRLLTALYIVYEEWTVQTNRSNLATHYLVDATR